MLDRREFLRSVMAGAASVALTPRGVFGGRPRAAETFFTVHPFVEANPSAVFIMRTSVDAKTNSAAVRQAGLDFGTSLFLPSAGSGVPISHRVVLKPNIVMMPVEGPEYMGIVTDCHFVEGIIESLKTLGVQGNQVYIREVNHPEDFENSGYLQMASRTGADIRALNAPIGEISEDDIQWVDVPEGMWFTKIPFLWPVNAPDTWLLNIAKFKSHHLGMTLCAKNLQGTNAFPYVAHCATYGYDMGLLPGHVRADALEQIAANYQRHVADGVPRWDRPGSEGGLWLETWATRCLDNNSVIPAGLHIIEAIYGREGPFLAGPGPSGEAIDYMANMVIFGKNQFHVDLIGYWLGGHEPGNIGLFHLAMERGMASFLNPLDVPLYEWQPGVGAIAADLGSFQRVPLRTTYLRRDYDGQNETEWHLVNEPYEYSTVTTKTVTVGEGWNLISLPLVSPETRPSALFPSAVSDAFVYDGRYMQRDHLAAGSGYWLKFAGQGAFVLSGTRVTSRTIPVKRGWNLVGPFDTPVPVTSVGSAPAGIIESFFFGYDNGYAVASTLEVGRGYWVKVTQDGVLSIGTGKKQTALEPGPLPDSWTALEARDAFGRCSRVFFSDPGGIPLWRQLPPPAPSGSFEVRFATNNYVEAHGTSQVLVLSGCRYPVGITAFRTGGRKLRLSDNSGIGLVDAELAEGHPVVIRQESGALLIREVSEGPQEYHLSQNHPNPFNAVTHVRFDIPVPSMVSLEVFNALGERVAVPARGHYSPGTYETSIQGGSLPSGVYILQFKAEPLDSGTAAAFDPHAGSPGRFAATKRMVLIR